METKTESMENKMNETLPDWIKPEVKELDINAITLSGDTGVGFDNVDEVVKTQNQDD